MALNFQPSVGLGVQSGLCKKILRGESICLCQNQCTRRSSYV